MKLTLFLIAICLILLTTTCRRSTEPLENYNQNISLTVESAEVTEVWLLLKVEPLDTRMTYVVQRDTHTVFSGSLERTDTLLHDENLRPASDYEYTAYRTVQEKKLRTIVTAKTTTMDTTSHDFTWQMFEFGEKSSSTFYDVAIINENDIWAVGEIYTKETYTYVNGVWQDPYNAAHWDGERWELKRILYKGEFWVINTVYAFNSDDIWFEAYMRWNGKNFIELEIPEIMTGFGINKTWGKSSTDFYVVGNNGQIRHYNGVRWQKIESGTDLSIHDIWGAFNERTGKYEIYCIAAQWDQNHGKKVLQINDTQTISINDNGLSWSLASIWFIPDKIYYIAGDGLYPNRTMRDKWIRDTSLPKYYKYAVSN